MGCPVERGQSVLQDGLAGDPDQLLGEVQTHPGPNPTRQQDGNVLQTARTAGDHARTPLRTIGYSAAMSVERLPATYRQDPTGSPLLDGAAAPYSTVRQPPLDGAAAPTRRNQAVAGKGTPVAEWQRYPCGFF